jgi:hypothetical protein
MLLLEILSSSVVPALLLILVLALTLHIIYLNKSFKHRIRLIVAIKMEEERLAKRLNAQLPSINKPLPSDTLATPVVKEAKQPEPIELYDDGKDLDYTKFN